MAPHSTRRERVEVSPTRARQGEIILTRRWQRILFVLGLVGLVIIGALATLLAR